MLRELGVTKYRADGIELELAPVVKAVAPEPAQAPVRQARAPRSGELQALLNKLDPAYSDGALFDIR
jgi:hypothetical protein